jgi:hypothetical protein
MSDLPFEGDYTLDVLFDTGKVGTLDFHLVP